MKRSIFAFLALAVIFPNMVFARENEEFFRKNGSGLEEKIGKSLAFFKPTGSSSVFLIAGNPCFARDSFSFEGKMTKDTSSKGETEDKEADSSVNELKKKNYLFLANKISGFLNNIR